METRDNILWTLRDESIGNSTNVSSAEELFQNKTLRPILKLQNDLFNQVFINYAIKQKGTFFDLNPVKKLSYIENVIQKDIKFRNSMKGIVIGMFTIEEYELYIQNASNINKRMMNMLIERLKSQIQFLEKINGFF